MELMDQPSGTNSPDSDQLEETTPIYGTVTVKSVVGAASLIQEEGEVEGL